MWHLGSSEVFKSGGVCGCKAAGAPAGAAPQLRPDPSSSLSFQAVGRPRSREDRRAAPGPSLPGDADAAAPRASPAQLPGRGAPAPGSVEPRSCTGAGGSGGLGLRLCGLGQQARPSPYPRGNPDRGRVGAHRARSPAAPASRCRCCPSGRTRAPAKRFGPTDLTGFAL